jgi:Flp pilus assembly pilin Flp
MHAKARGGKGMLNRAKDEKSDGIFRELCIKIQSLPRNEKGQALVEYSLLLGISSVFSGVIAFLGDHSIIVITIMMAFLIFFLFWKPKVTATVVFIMLLLYGLLLLSHYVEYGHI